MKIGPRSYKYAKQLVGIGRFSTVEIEIKPRENESIVIDNCRWETMKKSYPNFVEIGIWKKSAIAAANSIIESYETYKPIEIRINDISGISVDTSLSCIGAAIFIGVFDYLNDELDENALKSIDDFVILNNDFNTIPDYDLLNIGKKRK